MPAQNPTDFGPHTRRGLPQEDAAKHHPPEQADDKRGTKFSVECQPGCLPPIGHTVQPTRNVLFPIFGNRDHHEHTDP
jgi:hypothetical protein